MEWNWCCQIITIGGMHNTSWTFKIQKKERAQNNNLVQKMKIKIKIKISSVPKAASKFTNTFFQKKNKKFHQHQIKISLFHAPKHSPMADLLVSPSLSLTSLILTSEFISFHFCLTNVSLCSVQRGHLVPLRNYVQEDASIPKIPLSHGLNCIGRNSTPSLTDKRLSRNHLVLTVAASADSSANLVVVNY